MAKHYKLQDDSQQYIVDVDPEATLSEKYGDLVGEECDSFSEECQDQEYDDEENAQQYQNLSYPYDHAAHVRYATSPTYHPYAHSSGSSSRETSGSFQPMLRSAISPFHRRKKSVDFHHLTHRRRTVRYLCWAVLATLVLFILFLWRASLVSRRQVELGIGEGERPVQPPAWEEFPFLTKYFGGVRSLVSGEENAPEYPAFEGEPVAPDTEAVEGEKGGGDDVDVRINGVRVRDQEKETILATSVPFDPYSASEYRDSRVDCFMDEQGKIQIPKVHYYPGVPRGMPNPIIGSHETVGLKNDVCFDRFGRLGPYGFGYSTAKGGTGTGMNGERVGADAMWTQTGSVPEVDFRNVKWANVQAKCLQKNSDRFNSSRFLAAGYDRLFTEMEVKPGEELLPRRSNKTDQLQPAHIMKLLPRTAVVIRTWWDHAYSTEDIIYLRSLIVELSLLSGGEYTVHFLVHVKDDSLPIWADRQIYDRVLENSLPEEFRGMGTLWSERQMSLIYSGLQETFFRDLPVHGVYRGLFLALQYFSNQHPEYEYVWNWEMDARYTGHWYHLFDQVRTWAKEQPRKGLWERNGRFYVPAVHGSWEDFKQMVRVQSEMGTESANNMWSGLNAGAGDVPGSPRGKGDKPVWGPEGPADMLSGQDNPVPPTSPERDHYEWGVGEEADLISFSPIFDPDGTTWFYVEDISGYNTSAGYPPRRATIGTSSRLSRRLLQTMHREMILSRHHMFTEMWPSSIALHHGLKAVYVPHPVYIDRRWPINYLAGVMNGGRNGASGGARTSVYGGREHNFKGQTWFYDAGFAPNLWRRWLGYKVDNDGGEQEEQAGEGRMCLPAMLLHPVKNVQLVVEGGRRVNETETEDPLITPDDADWDWETMG